MSRLKDFQTLKSNKEFGYFYNNSKKKHVRSIIAFYKESETQKVGFTASKKIGNAVKRNFAKRRMRAAFLNLHTSLKNGTYIFVAKKEILDMDFVEVQKDIRYALKKLSALHTHAS